MHRMRYRWGAVLLGLLLLLCGFEARAANLTISSASVNSTGRTLTANIGNVSGTLTTPGSAAVTNWYVYQTIGGVRYDVTSASITVNASSLTIALNGTVQAGATIQIQAVGSNLTDTASDVLLNYNTYDAGTNGSTVAGVVSGMTNVGFADFRVDTSASFATTQFGVSADFQFNGTGLDIAFQTNTGAPSLQVLIDNTTTVTVPGDPSGSQQIANIVSGLTAGVHTAKVTVVAGTAKIGTANGLIVTGGTGAITKPSATATNAPASWSIYPSAGFNQYWPVLANNALSSWLTAEGGANADTAPSDAFFRGGSYLQAANAASDVTIAFNGQFTDLRLLTANSMSLILYCDGVQVSSFSTSNATWYSVSLTAVADLSVSHSWRIGFNSGAGTGLEAVLTSGGGGISNSPPAARPYLMFVGDSITSANFATGGSQNGFAHLVSTQHNAAIINRGYSGSTVYQGDSNSGVARKATFGKGTGNPSGITVLYGTNDMQGNAGTVTLDQFQAAFYTMMKGIFDTGLASNVPIYVIHILPRRFQGPDGISHGPYDFIKSWNDRIDLACGSGGDGAGNVLTTGQRAQIHIIDPIPWGLNGSTSQTYDWTTADYTTNYNDSLHPSTAGYQLIANKIGNLFFPIITRKPNYTRGSRNEGRHGGRN